MPGARRGEFLGLLDVLAWIVGTMLHSAPDDLSSAREVTTNVVTLTYLVLVVAVAVVVWLAVGRPFPGAASRGRSGAQRGPTTDRLRILVTGGARPSADLVERMAACLAEHTTVFGTSYAIPSYLAAVLPKGVFDAASAVKPRLTAEVLERFTALITEQHRRSGRRGPEFALPPDHRLRLVLACGPEERLLVSFDPIVDVHAALSESGVAVPQVALPVAVDGSTTGRRTTRVGGDTPTTRRADPAGRGTAFVLTVDGVQQAQRHLGGRTNVLVVGRGQAADLRCPDTLSDVSRSHAELTLAHGQVYVEDKHSANGTWVQRGDGPPERLAPGELVRIEHGDTVWLDEDRRVAVTQR